ncbi:bifunctional adenosylcobinamide kinase/adenosylcobinamide-phosphate guanylyltransferase [Anaerostipes sp.]|uniref:bifunctional adenosylcobinamide kinase/adenosylcobinamide-phosphate guanylyltransferase n=1 Tax=Anaerostipes sp. TaxID=1872530 RepID=UPI0025B8ECC9|nr:bifunctional adenosylcobinamide kinase/adenosylcobinamide-phosphate guanylyltransferase [Anaerostipes sp.]MBS7007391.1 bifunctional adenosylcobinamide kinase/adenosylcobinamide-phosphate guanylyltransferase [Anaerostipes sp.]
MFTLITGGSGSGKSEYAEGFTDSWKEPKIYIATMFPYDEETEKKIQRHREMRRDRGFVTLECFTGLSAVRLPEGAHVLLDCMSNLAANEMFMEEGAGTGTPEEILAGIEKLLKEAEDICIVTNEIFSDGIKYPPETVQYQEYLGFLNCRMAQMADRVVEVVYGIPLIQKG